MIAWDHVRHFSPHEFADPDVPGSGQSINGVLLYALDELRNKTGWPIRIHWEDGGAVDVRGAHGHALGSYHLLANGARAADWHFDCDAPARAQIRAVLQAGFGGTGIYYNWGVPVGFHTDVRPCEKYQVWVQHQRNEYIYLVRERS